MKKYLLSYPASLKNIFQKIPIFLVSFVLFLALFSPFKTRATIFFDPDISLSFDPNYIISDQELTDYQAMNLSQMEECLRAMGGTLNQEKFEDTDGKIKSGTEIIYRASQEYKINPRFLLVLLQREKGLLTNLNPSTDDYNWATGFTCYDYSQPVSRFRGFAIQIDRAAWRFRYYLEHPWQFEFRAGVETKTLVNWKDRTYAPNYSMIVTPKNLATAALYNYAPHIYDNRLFWKIWHWEIWKNWFSEENNKIPNGSLVRAEGENGVWLIQGGKKRPFHSRTVFLFSYKFSDVKVVDKSDLETYEIGAAMSFPNYSLVQIPSDNIFMLIDNKKHPISEKIFRAIGFRPEEIISVDITDLSSYELSSPISSPYPTGALLQDNASKGVYYVKGNIKYPIVDAEILNTNYPYGHVIKVSPQELAEFEDGEQIKLKDGTLIKTAENPAIYVISEGKRLPIYSEQTFEDLGYLWERVIIVSKEILNMHPEGEMLKIE